MVVLISEQTGEVKICVNGEFLVIDSDNMLREKISQALKDNRLNEKITNEKMGKRYGSSDYHF